MHSIVLYNSAISATYDELAIALVMNSGSLQHFGGVSRIATAPYISFSRKSTILSPFANTDPLGRYVGGEAALPYATVNPTPLRMSLVDQPG
jgi:hypothetical protein